MLRIANEVDILERVSEPEKEDVSRLLQLGLEAVRAADGYYAVQKAVSYGGNMLRITGKDGEPKEYILSRYERVYVLGFGKASEPMVKAVYDLLGDRMTGGAILVRRGTRKDRRLGKIHILEGDHPTPTEDGYENAKELTKFVVETPKENSLYLVLISGGGSSIYADFSSDIPVSDGIELNNLLVNARAYIGEINAVRKHTAYAKGGQLARLLQGAEVAALIVSDVPRNPLDKIASGPTAPDTTTFQDAKAALEKYGLWKKVADPVRQRILKGIAGELSETPKPGDPCFENVRHYIVADALTALKAVEEKVKGGYRGCPVQAIPEVMEGEVSDSLACELLAQFSPGFTLLAHEYNYGVEPSTAKEGGRQLHLLLLMLKAIKKGSQEPKIYIEGIATDGKDGNSWAGAIITPSLIDTTELEEIEKAERENNSGGFFRAKGLLIRMESDYGLDDTGTNVNNIIIAYRP